MFEIGKTDDWIISQMREKYPAAFKGIDFQTKRKALWDGRVKILDREIRHDRKTDLERRDSILKANMKRDLREMAALQNKKGGIQNKKGGKNMEENEVEVAEVRKFSHNSWIGVWKQGRLLWIGYTSAQVDGEKREDGKIKPLSLKITAKKREDGTPYLEVEKAGQVEGEKLIVKPAEAVIEKPVAETPKVEETLALVDVKVV